MVPFKEQIYIVRKDGDYKCVQHITNEFWSRCRKEFLTNLETRMKWNETRRNVKVGDIVLLKDEHSGNQ